MSDKSIADLECAVEKSWDDWKRFEGIPSCMWSHLREPLADWLAARRAAREDGMVSVLVSHEAVEALREVQRGVFDAPDTIEHARAKACLFLARDLARVLNSVKRAA